MRLIDNRSSKSIIIAFAIFLLACLYMIPVFCLEDNTARNGGDYRQFVPTDPDPNLCQQACDADPNCQAFSYLKPAGQWTKGSCWLKNTVPPATADSGCISGVKTASTIPSQAVPQAQSTEMDDNTDRYGGDYRSFEPASPDPNLCKQACDADPNCQAFSYIKGTSTYPMGSCWLKNTVPPATPNTCCISGVKTASGGPTPLPSSVWKSIGFAQLYSNIPGLVLHLWHNWNQPDPKLVPTKPNLRFFHGGDLGSKISAPFYYGEGGGGGTGYNWWMVQDNSNMNPVDLASQLPSGIVLGLKHSKNQEKEMRITVCGHDPTKDSIGGFAAIAPDYVGLIRQDGGDQGGSEGEGYYWYETKNPNFQNWDYAETNLPKGTILGLKSSSNQRDKVVYWRGQMYDPMKLREAAPPTFVAKYGADLGASSGEGYFWFEKVTGPDFFQSTG